MEKESSLVSRLKNLDEGRYLSFKVFLKQIHRNYNCLRKFANPKLGEIYGKNRFLKNYISWCINNCCEYLFQRGIINNFEITKLELEVFSFVSPYTFLGGFEGGVPCVCKGIIEEFKRDLRRAPNTAYDSFFNPIISKIMSTNVLLFCLNYDFLRNKPYYKLSNLLCAAQYELLERQENFERICKG